MHPLLLLAPAALCTFVALFMAVTAALDIRDGRLRLLGADMVPITIIILVAATAAALAVAPIFMGLAR
jgi:hypothetical protein